MVTAVTLLTATLALGGFQAAGLGSNHQDIAPRYSGILFGITNATSSIAGCAGIMGTGEPQTARCLSKGETRRTQGLATLQCTEPADVWQCGSDCEPTAMTCAILDLS